VPSQPETQLAEPDFLLPMVDATPSAEAGVIIMGLEVEQLMVGLGLVALADYPTAVTLLVDQARHTGVAQVTGKDLVALGVRLWQAERDALGSWPAHQASLRQAWEQTYRAVEHGRPGAAAAYLTACLLRRPEVDRYLTARMDSKGPNTTVRSD
jgi:hypothetical protein